MSKFRNHAGFALLEILIFAAIIPPALLIASRASDVVAKTSQMFKANSTKNSMNVVRSYLISKALNPETDGVFDLLKDSAGGSGGGLPVSLPLNLSDEWGVPYRYCNWDTGVPNSINAGYSQNTVGAPGGGVIGQIISSGKDKVFQTTCGAPAALGDDIMSNIYNSEVLSSNGMVAGWSDNGPSVTLLNPADNVGLGVPTPTHKLELAAGILPSAGIALGEVEIYRSAANTLSMSVGNSFNLDSGSLLVGGTAVIDSSRNITGNNITGNSLTLDGGVLSMANATSNMVVMGGAGIGAPSIMVRSLGTKVVLSPTLGAGSADFALGIEGNALWQSVNLPTSSFKWYGGTSNIMALDGTGHLGIGIAPDVAYSINALGAINASSLYVAGVLLPTTVAGTVAGQTLYWDGVKWAANNGLMYDTGTGSITVASGSLNVASGPLQIGGVTVLDASRNLVGVNSVGGNLIPSVANTYNLGSIGSQWANVYSNGLFQNGNKVADVFGSSIGYLSKFTGVNTLGNSLIFDNGTSIGIGKIPGAYALDVAGSINITGNYYLNGVPFSGGIAAGSVAGQTNYWNGTSWQPNSGLFYNSANGSVGIGTTTPSANARLDVNQLSPGVGGYFHTSSLTGSNIAINPEAISATTGANIGVWATAANGLLGNTAIYIPVNYPPSGAGNYAFRSDSLAQSSFSGYVGIGTITPKSTLDVHGSAQVSDGGSDPDTLSYASFGVTRPASGSDLSYIGMTKQSTVSWGTGIGGDNTYIVGNAISGKTINRALSLTTPGDLTINRQMNAPAAAGLGGYISSGNYAGTGSAAYFPAGLYSNGANAWISGTVYFTGALSGATSISAGSMTATTFNGALNGNATTASSSPLLSALSNFSWSASTLPASYNLGVQTSFVQGADGFPSYGSVMNMTTYGGGGGALQLYTPYSPTYGGTGLKVRFGNYDVNSGNSWTAWKTLLASDNFNSYSPTLTGVGATGTWGINVTGNAATATNVAWSGITDKPSYIFSYQGFALDANAMGSNVSGFSYSNNAPWTGPIVDFSGNGNYDLQLNAQYSVGGNMSFRTHNGDGAYWNSWHILLNDANYNSYVPNLTGVGASGTWGISVSGNAVTASTLSGDQTNWYSIRHSAVANMIGWKNYGNGHVIFDASNSTSPAGSAIDNTNSQIVWSPAYPTLMGWNGASTYGVRVDSARVADTAASATYAP